MMAVNYWGDAGNLFSNSYDKKIASLVLSGNCITDISNYDERLVVKELAKSSKTRYDLLIIGSSRTLIINSSDFKNLKIFNSSVSGAGIEDLVGIYQMYKERKMLPGKILFGIDPWIFNENNGQNRWLPLKDEYLHFFAGQQPIEVNRGVKERKFMQVISPSYFQSSVKNLPALITKGGVWPRITTSKYNQSNTRLTDYSLVWGESMRNATPAQIANKAESYLTNEISIVDHYDLLSPKVIKIFNMLIADCKKNNVDVGFILQPYNPLIDQAIKKNRPMINKAQDYIEKFAQTHHIKIFGSFDPIKLGLDKSYFYDGSHGNDAAIKKILGTDKWLESK